MKIKSKFKDYYDSVAHAFMYDSDPNIKYIRDTIELNTPEHEKNIELFCKKYFIDDIFYNRSGIVFFCGKAYPFYEFSFSFESYDESTIIFGINKAIKTLSSELFIETKINKAKSFINVKKFNDKFVRNEIKKLHDAFVKNFTDINSWRSSIIEIKDEYFIGDDLFKTYDCPILLVRNTSYNKCFVKNPNLSQLSFQQVIDPYTTFQEIEMYLGSNLAKQMDPDVKLSDEIKAEIHGFDKWSFRNKVR